MIVLDNSDCAEKLNELARLKMIEKILKDIACDMMVCKLEGYCAKEYTNQIKKEIDELFLKINSF